MGTSRGPPVTTHGNGFTSWQQFQSVQPTAASNCYHAVTNLIMQHAAPLAPFAEPANLFQMFFSQVLSSCYVRTTRFPFHLTDFTQV